MKTLKTNWLEESFDEALTRNGYVDIGGTLKKWSTANKSWENLAFDVAKRMFVQHLAQYAPRLMEGLVDTLRKQGTVLDGRCLKQKNPATGEWVIITPDDLADLIGGSPRGQDNN